MQLLRITRIPMKMTRTVVSPARLEIRQPSPEVRMQTTPSKLTMDSENIKVNIDSFNARTSSGLQSARVMSEEFAQLGVAGAAEATASYAEIGNQLAQIQRGAPSIPDIYYQKTAPKTYPTGIKFTPDQPLDITWQQNSLDIEYQPATIEFTPNVMRNTMEFIPAQTQVNIEQYPALQIEYIGEPIYVPPSANPNYQGPK